MLLNEEQYSAVLAVSGPIVICAGAGSGKTRVIAYRVLHLINTGVVPEEITCVTFTNKAAREMKERIGSLCSGFGSLPVITTFHGYALRLIRTYGAKYNISNHTILGDDDQENIIKNIMKVFDIKDKQCTSKKIISHINYIKNNFFNEIVLPSDIDHGLFKSLYEAYEAEKKKMCVFDFDDLLLYGLKLLRDSEILEKVRVHMKHLMIDEYQDTNSIQHEFVKIIALNKNKELILDSLFVVGDEDQSIYSWRGANVENILHFKKDFPHALFLKLTRNYRSTKTILSLANSIIAKNNDRNKKDLWTDKNNNIPVFLVELQSGYQEAELVIKLIKKLTINKTIGSCAILYRSHYQSRIFEELCITHNIKYRVYGGLNFYQRQEIKDILSYLCLAVNQYDKRAFIRCCNTPSRGFGDVSQREFIDFWIEDNGTIIDAIEKYTISQRLSERNKLILLDLKNILESILTYKNPADAITFIIKKTNYYNYIEKNAENEIEITTRKENLQELITASKTFTEEFNANIFDFIDHLAVFYEKNDDSEENEKNNNCILLMSIHAAKGLEFSTVFIVGCEEGIFPSNRSALSNDSLEEERRLLYVAITRAKERLICTYALSRALWGSIRAQIPSIFTYDFDSEYTKKLSFKSSSINFIEKIILQENINHESLSELTIKNVEERKNILHPLFGFGEIIEKDSSYITIKFKDGVKKIKFEYIKNLYNDIN